MTDAAWGGPARVIGGRYRLDHPIGQGGMGEVWAGYDERLDRRVAVKLMKQPAVAALPGPAGTGSSSLQRTAAGNARQRFLREVRTTAALNHPGIPAVYDTGVDEAGGDLYLVMQLLAGAELADLIAGYDYRGAPPPVAWATAIGAQVAAVLADAHGRSVVHRDIKPRNLFLTPGGIVKVLDFGVAALLGAGDIAKLTVVGQTIGTPPYMSPEQTLANAVGPAADIYSLGCVLHEALTGELPLRARGGVSVQWHHVHTTPPPIRALRPDVPERIESLVAAMLAKSPEQRPDAAAAYETLLRHTRDSPAAPGRDELDPTLPFVRPMGPTPYRAPSAATAVAAPAPAVRLSEAEADAATNQARALVGEGHFTQAADVLAAAVARCGNDRLLAAELRFSLANVLFVAGSYADARTEFEAAKTGFTEAYGPDDENVRHCRYYIATCQAALGENTAALTGFRALLAEQPADVNARDSEALDARRQVGLLLSALGRYQEALATLAELHRDYIARDGEESPEATAVAALRDRISRYDT